MTLWQRMVPRERKLCVALLVAMLFTAGCTGNSLGYIVRGEPLICEWIPWWPGCSGEGDGNGGGGSGAGYLPQ